MTFQANTAPSLIDKARPILKRGSWRGGIEAVCMMSAMVKGAQSTEDCVTAGWPKWLVDLNVYLFDEDVGADDEDLAAWEFARAVAEAVSVPVDTDKACDLFLISRLDTGEFSALKTLESLDGEWGEQKKAVSDVVALLWRRVAGEDVAEEMRAAARAATLAAARAAPCTTARAATRAATHAAPGDAAFAAANATLAAALAAADAAPGDAVDAAHAASRANLIQALADARVEA